MSVRFFLHDVHGFGTSSERAVHCGSDSNGAEPWNKEIGFWWSQNMCRGETMQCSNCGKRTIREMNKATRKCSQNNPVRDGTLKLLPDEEFDKPASKSASQHFLAAKREITAVHKSDAFLYVERQAMWDQEATETRSVTSWSELGEKHTDMKRSVHAKMNQNIPEQQCDNTTGVWPIRCKLHADSTL